MLSTSKYKSLTKAYWAKYSLTKGKIFNFSLAVLSLSKDALSSSLSSEYISFNLEYSSSFQ